MDDPAPTRTVGWILVVLQVELSLPVRRSEAVPGLRASDAAHMDERRAPRLLTTIMRPSGTSDEHWNLNGKLARPQADGDAIVYSSGPEFLVDDADPRWRCFDAAQVSDTELREVDILPGEPHLSEICDAKGPRCRIASKVRAIRSDRRTESGRCAAANLESAEAGSAGREAQ